MNPEETVALVTGANRGIGRALVEALLVAGVSRVYAGARDPDAVALHPRVWPVRLDVTDPATIETAARVLGDVTLLVNNAGVLGAEPLIGARDPGAAEREMRVNYFGPLALTRAFAPILARNGGGAIVNVL